MHIQTKCRGRTHRNKIYQLQNQVKVAIIIITDFLSAEDFIRQENQKLIESSKNDVEKTLVPIRKYIPLVKDVN